MHVLLALLSASAHAVSNLSTRMYQTACQKTLADFRLFQALMAIVAAVLNLILAGFVVEAEPLGLILGLCYGVALAAAAMLVAACYACGPMSLTGVIVSACLVLPIAVGCIWYGEVMTGTQILGCVLLAATFLMSAVNPKADRKAKTAIPAKWYLLVSLAFFSNGMCAVLQNIYGRTAAVEQSNAFMAFGFLVSAVIFGADVFRLSRKYCPVEKKTVLRPGMLLLVLLAAFGSFLGNLLLMYLNTAMPASVLYPLVNGSLAVIVSLLSCVVFREKMTVQRALTILVGLGAIVSLNL